MSLKDTLINIAPTIATSLGGPLAGGVVKLISKELLGKEDATHDEVLNAVKNATPDQIAKIKEIEANFQIEMNRIAVENTKSAREMAKLNMIPQIILSGLFVFGYFIVLMAIAIGYVAPTDTMKDPLLLLLGVMTRELPTIMQFWFGSSFGSKRKTEISESLK
jgi:hypothetical protein